MRIQYIHQPLAPMTRRHQPRSCLVHQYAPTWLTSGNWLQMRQETKIMFLQSTFLNVRKTSQSNRSQNCNQSYRSLPKIPMGSTVRIGENNSWHVKAKVVDKECIRPSYVVETEVETTRWRSLWNL